MIVANLDISFPLELVKTSNSKTRRREKDAIFTKNV